MQADHRERRRTPAGRRPGLALRMLAALALLVAIAPPVAAERLAGRAEAVEGDILRLAGIEVRLFGIDAPEPGQSCEWGEEAVACGEGATAALAALLQNAWVRCVHRGRDRHGRILATCHDDQGRDLARAMVAAGWAMAYREYSSAYLAPELEARRAVRGIWQGTFVEPWRHRGDLETRRCMNSCPPNRGTDAVGGTTSYIRRDR